MSIVLSKTSLKQRLLPLVRGYDLLLLLPVSILCGIGLVTMYSAAFGHGTHFVDHGRNMLMAAGILLVVSQVPPQRLAALAVPIYVVAVALLVMVALFGITKKGAQRWINVGMVIQPGELSKIAVPMMLAWWFQSRDGMPRWPTFLGAFGLLMLPVCFLMKQPDLGTSLLVMGAGLAVIFFGGLPWKLLIPPAVLTVVGIFLLIWNEPRLCADGMSWYFLHDYQRTRVCTLLDPTRDPLGKGFHIIQGMIAIGSGGIYGKGFMRGTQTHLDFIPERTTDFIFAVYSEEFGFVGNLILIGSFLFLVLRALLISVRANSVFGRLLAGGMATMFFTYAFVNMGMVSGILPVVGVPLPFVSYGGTAMVTLGLGLGLLMSIARDREPKQRPSSLG
ncbi:TPA: rod shape-determining protein RodA [Pseudomonas aeruginosa]|uniref:rod shape-determining protein RodA n=1 Tax=Pseudomonas aeruginosa TaxID=287 RepID=UPI000F53147D|nr:rod shape-determining protein RodA [Pseudomonas aeruginosa]MCO2027311.1 rod shape-determining protein RodA [Pseudomonas aeruginosa]RPV85254.1 rod shape-determining protein RodA [Pseudomonas aeruginosa]WPM38956.1 rod shape-determining protein RodA [Pseudomonas aeruginosa]HBO1748714.1 rod shape-determining protein RodA [Pseudomonas aeruginosa]HBO8808228.1 rod shape-determining protein RodA [Pseudomonas aeruginosa]